MSNYTIRPLNTGFVPTNPFQYHFHFSCAPYLKGVPNEKVPLPVFTFLIEGGDKLVLVDTGIGTLLARWAEGANISVLVLAWLIAVLIRLATGSAWRAPSSWTTTRATSRRPPGWA